MSRQQGQDLVAPAMCVLGCNPGSAAFVRRARAASEAYATGTFSRVVACGGVVRGEAVEADRLADLLVAGGVPPAAIARERDSADTWENALFAATLLEESQIRRVVIVTCSWHLPRAKMLFTRAGLNVIAGIGVPPPRPGLLERAWWVAREKASTWRDLHR